MKKDLIFSCLITAALVSGCIKEENEPYTILRDVSQNTIESSLKGYMYGTAQADSLVENSFRTIITANGLEDLDVYITVESIFDTIDTKRNAVKECGYVYSGTNECPTVKGDDCHLFNKDNITWHGDTTSTSLQFSGTQNGLNFNHNYFLRSYVVTTKGDTCYNPQIKHIKTVIPSNVWFKRKEAMLSARSEAISATTDGGLVYVYGGRGTAQCYSDMWVYNSKNDTWEQKASFSDNQAILATPTERCNGAAFMYTNTKGGKNDTLMFILGGENFSGTPTEHNFIYSLKNDRYENSIDHPNGRIYVEPFQQPRTGLVAFNIESEFGDVFHCVGLGKYLFDKGSNSTAIETQIYYYDAYYDKIVYDKDNKDDMTHVHTWQALGSLSTDGKTVMEHTAIGFYQPVAVSINAKTAFVGTGESSDGKYRSLFYHVTIDNNGQLALKGPILPPSEFKARRNAAAFHLKYEKNGSEYDRFFIGTGCDSEGYPLKDFWAYDFSNGRWEQIADCGNIYREGAIGFKVVRIDDYFVKNFSEPQERGIVAFGRGTDLGGEKVECPVRKDVWEYLP